MKYLEAILHIKVKYSNVEDDNTLPYYLKDEYEFKYAYIGKIKTLFVYISNEEYRIQWKELKKHIEIFKNNYELPVVVVPYKLNAYERNILIKNAQPFIVENRQIYLPFLGIALEDVFSRISRQTLSPLAQLIFLYFIYCDKDELYLDDLIDDIPYTRMSISRALSEIEELDEVFSGKDGVRKFIYSDTKKQDLYELNLRFFSEPVRKKYYINKDSFINMHIDKYIVAGETALALYGMLNPPELTTYATKIDIKDITEYEQTLFDVDNQYCLEIWKYDPTILTNKFFDGKKIDYLSLHSSLDYDDERIEKELDICYNKFWKELNDKRNRKF